MALCWPSARGDARMPSMDKLQRIVLVLVVITALVQVLRALF
jgi:hypothetical protein